MAVNKEANKLARQIAYPVFDMLVPCEDMVTTRARLTAELERYREFLQIDEDDCSDRRMQDTLYKMIRKNHPEIKEIDKGYGRSFVGIGFRLDVEAHEAKAQKEQEETDAEMSRLEKVRKEQEEQLIKEQEERKEKERMYNEAHEMGWEIYEYIKKPIMEEVGYAEAYVTPRVIINEDGSVSIEHMNPPQKKKVNWGNGIKETKKTEKELREEERRLNYLLLLRERHGDQYLSNNDKNLIEKVNTTSV